MVRPRTQFTLARKTLRCPKCGAAINRQRKRCKRCAAAQPKGR